MYIPANTSGVSRRTVLLTATYTPPSPLQLHSYEYLRVLGEHCSHRRTGTRAGYVATVCIVSDMGLGPNGTIKGFGKERNASLVLHCVGD